MKLVALIIKKYACFENEIFHFSDEYRVKFNWDTKEFEIVDNESYMSNFYSKVVDNITLIVGPNGSGKTTLLNALGYYYRDGKSDNIDFPYLLLYEKRGEFFVQDFYLLTGTKSTFKLSKKDETTSTYIKDYEAILKRRNDYIRVTDKSIPGTYGGVDGDINVDYRKVGKLFSAYKYLKQQGIVQSALRFSFSLPRSENKSTSDDMVVDLCYRILYSIQNIEIEEDNVRKAPPYVAIIRKYLDEQMVGDTKVSSQETLNNIKELLSGEVGCSVAISYLESLSDLLTVLGEIEDKKILTKRLDSQAYHGEYLEFCCDIDNKEEKAPKTEQEDNEIKCMENFEDKLEIYNKALDALGNRNYSDFSNIFTEYNMSFQMSTGEQNLIRLFARIFAKIKDESLDEKKHFIFIVDEIESGIHPEWSRKLTNFIVESMKDLNTENNKDFTYQFVFSTHSPFMLTDIKQGNVIVLPRDKNGKEGENTFAKNILEILNDDMFVSNVYGDFALKKIRAIIENIEHKKSSPTIKGEIEMISEPLVRNKLMDMYLRETKIDIFLNSLSPEEIEELRKRLPKEE